MNRTPDTQPTIIEYLLIVALVTIVLILVFVLVVPR